MKHLDERVSDLVDDRLDHEERDRALAHVAQCQHCREAVDTERYAKGVLFSLPDAELPAALLGKLYALAEPAGPLPPEQAPPGPPAQVAPWGPAPAARPEAAHHGGGSGAGHAPTRSRFIDQHRRGVRVVAGGMVSTGALLVLLASLGAPSNAERDQTPAAVVPPLEQFTIEHARATGGLPFAEPASIIAPVLSSSDNGAGASSGAGSAGLGQSGVLDGLGVAGSKASE